MTETSADWVERPRPTDVAALTTRQVTPAKPRRERVQESAKALDPRLAGGAGAVLAVLVAVLLDRRRRR
jgi:hypothetical protein